MPYSAELKKICSLYNVSVTWSITCQLLLRIQVELQNTATTKLTQVKVRGNQISRRRAGSEATKAPAYQRRRREYRAPSAEGVRIEARKALSGVRNGEGYAGPGGAPAENDFGAFLGALKRLSLQYLSQILHFPANFEAEPSPTCM